MQRERSRESPAKGIAFMCGLTVALSSAFILAVQRLA